jgi:hypothetical protein
VVPGVVAAAVAAGVTGAVIDGTAPLVRAPTRVTLHARPQQVAALLRRPARPIGPFSEN